LCDSSVLQKGETMPVLLGRSDAGNGGYELATLMRSDEGTRCVPVIFVSAVHSDKFYIFKGYESGAVDFITKPLTWVML